MPFIFYRLPAKSKSKISKSKIKPECGGNVDLKSQNGGFRSDLGVSRGASVKRSQIFGMLVTVDAIMHIE